MLLRVIQGSDARDELQRISETYKGIRSKHGETEMDLNWFLFPTPPAARRSQTFTGSDEEEENPGEHRPEQNEGEDDEDGEDEGEDDGWEEDNCKNKERNTVELRNEQHKGFGDNHPSGGEDIQSKPLGRRKTNNKAGSEHEGAPSRGLRPLKKKVNGTQAPGTSKARRQRKNPARIRDRDTQGEEPLQGILRNFGRQVSYLALASMHSP